MKYNLYCDYLFLSYKFLFNGNIKYIFNKKFKINVYLNDSMISKSIVVGIPIIFTISVNKIFISLKKKINFFILSSVIYCIDDCFPSLMEIIYSLFFQKTSEDSKNVEFNTVFLGKSGLNINRIGLILNINE